MYGVQVGSFVGQYRIDEPIGTGGMASVFRAYHPSLDRVVAVKVLPLVYAGDPDFTARFSQEARTVARLSHPHILDVFDFGEQDGVPYMVMEYVSGGTLDGRFISRIPFEFTAHVAEQIADGLDYAHERGIIHRDIKPRNILMRDDGTPVIADFGIAKIVESGAGLTRVGTILGTPEYMSPEQAMSQLLDARSDVYSLGVILYQMLVGRVPFTSESALTTIMAHVQEPLPPPRSINPAIPEPIERVLYKVLAKAPDDRYQSAGELAAALTQAISETRSAPLVEAGGTDRRRDDTRMGITALSIEEAAPLSVEAPPLNSLAPAPEPMAPTGLAPASPAAVASLADDPAPGERSALPRWLVPVAGALLALAVFGAVAAMGPWRAAPPSEPPPTAEAPSVLPVVNPAPGPTFTNVPAPTLTRPGATAVPVLPMGELGTPPPRP